MKFEKSEEASLCNKVKRLSGERKFTIQQHGVRCRTSNSVPIVSIKMSWSMFERKIGLRIFVTSIQMIM